MNPSTFIKQPWEERQLEFDITNALATGDSLASVTSVTVLFNGASQTDMVSGNPVIVGNKVYQKVISGVNNLDYTIRVRVVTTNGDKIEDEVTMKVRDS